MCSIANRLTCFSFSSAVEGALLVAIFGASNFVAVLATFLSWVEFLSMCRRQRVLANSSKNEKFTIHRHSDCVVLVIVLIDNFVQMDQLNMSLRTVS